MTIQELNTPTLTQPFLSALKVENLNRKLLLVEYELSGINGTDFSNINTADYSNPVQPEMKWVGDIGLIVGDVPRLLCQDCCST